MSALFRTSKKTLLILAAVVWYVGALMLLRSGFELLSQARALRPDSSWHWLFISLGALLGIIQARTLFASNCRKNLQRIRGLQDPRLWQFFHPGFFLALAGMIGTGILLNHLSHGFFFFMLFVAGLDFALTISLLGSSLVFWNEKIDLQGDRRIN